MSIAPSPVVVRRATIADRAAVLDTVLSAFVDDPAWAFITGGDMERVSPHFAAALFDGRVGNGTVWVTDDCSAVAMWASRTVDAVPDPASDEAWATYRAAVGEKAWESFEAYEAALKTDQPAPPYWYLGVLATHPSRQGQGLASQVWAPVFAMADEAGLDCWLETSKAANRDFYARRGFTESIEVDIPGGPTTWWMRRPPVG